MEAWKPIKGYEGLYEISSIGNVISLYGNNRKVLKPNMDNHGYLQVGLWAKGIKKTNKIHRLVATHSVSLVDGKEQINHIDGDKLNNSYYNLEWVTSRENTIHAATSGKLSNKKNKLDLTKARMIRALYKSGEFSQYVIANQFQCGVKTVRDVIQGKTWKDVSPRGYN